MIVKNIKVISKKMISLLPLEMKTRLFFRIRTGRKLNLDYPKRFNEKLQWLKLYWRDPIAKECADKYEVRKYVKERIGEEYLNQLIGVYNSVDDIDFDELPNQFVLKGTHGSGFNIIVKDKFEHNWENEKKKMNKWLNTNYYKTNNEWVYDGLQPKIICEKYLEDTVTGELRDYKFFTFNGEPQFLFIASNRGNGTKFDYFNLDFEPIEVQQLYPPSGLKLDRPKHFERMIELSRDLSKGFPHVRVDFFECNGKIYFSELTFFHFSGAENFYPDKYDFIFGEFLDLTIINNGGLNKK